MRDKLTLQSVTAGSQIILPGYPTAFALLGLLLAFQGASRTSGPAFEVARNLLPIPVWGAIFFSISVIQWGCMIYGNRKIFRATLIVGAGITAFWAYVITAAAAGDDRVSFTSSVWIALVCWAHIASARSVARDKVLPDRQVKI